MSLLNRGNTTVTVYPEQAVKTRDGNTLLKPSEVGTEVAAVVQPLTSTESQDIGDRTDQRYRMRLVGYAGVLGAASEVEWDGKRWTLDGDARVFNGSPRTRHVEYVIRRY